MEWASVRPRYLESCWNPRIPRPCRWPAHQWWLMQKSERLVRYVISKGNSPMAANLSKQERTWLQVESLETRALLSAVGPRVPIGVADPSLAASLLITAEISPKSDP